MRDCAMTEERDLRLRGVALPYALLRIALGLNICLHGVVRWALGLRNFAESLLPMLQKTLLPVWSIYSFGCVLHIVEALVGFRLRPHARFDVWVYFATRLADGRNTLYVFSGLFSFTRRNAR
jgi:hypothetical protein